MVPRRARILILGSLPGAASIAQQQYYAHPRNAFWPIVGHLLGFEPRLPYRTRLARLRARGVALWDVCFSAVRVGSLDASIRSPGLVANNIAGLLDAQSGIRAVFLNGATAAALYRKLVLPTLSPDQRAIPALTLPSTSPAHASRTQTEKRQAWSVILDRLETGPQSQ